MFKISVDVNGLQPGELVADAWQSISDKIRKRVRNIRCPDHGRVAEGLTLVAGPLGEIQEIKFTACCEKLRVAIHRAVA